MLSEMTSTKDYTAFTESPHNDLTCYSLGVGRAHFQADQSYGFEQAIHLLGSAIKLDPADLQCIPEVLANKGSIGWEAGDWIGNPTDLLLVTELNYSLNDWLQNLTGCSIKTLEQLVNWNRDNAVSPKQEVKPMFLLIWTVSCFP